MQESDIKSILGALINCHEYTRLTIKEPHEPLFIFIMTLTIICNYVFIYWFLCCSLVSVLNYKFQEDRHYRFTCLLPCTQWPMQCSVSIKCSIGSCGSNDHRLLEKNAGSFFFMSLITNNKGTKGAFRNTF